MSIIINLYKGMSDTLERDNYRCIKIIDQSVVEDLIRERVSISGMQLGFRP